MKNQYKAILAAMFCAATVTTLKASSGYDLIVGFTQAGGNTGGNDFLLDLGPVNPYPGQSGLSNGKTWALGSTFTAQNFNIKTVQWGILGDAIYADSQNPQTLWVTTTGNTPPPIINDANFSSIETSINGIEQVDFGGGVPNYQSFAGQNAVVAVSAGPNTQNSWNAQTIAGTLATQFVNAYGNPNVTGGTNGVVTLWQVPEGSTPPTKLGVFTLSNTGILTFNVVQSTPPAPRIVNITHTGTSSTIYFTTTNGGFTYSLHFTNTLTGALSNWPASLTTVVGNGLTNSLTDTTSATNRFYYIGVH